MTAKHMAELLSGRQYRNELTPEEELIAKQNGLVIVFGYSDDNIEFCGAISDERGCFSCGEDISVYVNQNGVYDEPGNNTAKIQIHWCSPKTNASWSYTTDIPHQTFNIYEGDELFCIGLVFNFYDLPEK